MNKTVIINLKTPKPKKLTKTQLRKELEEKMARTVLCYIMMSEFSEKGKPELGQAYFFLTYTSSRHEELLETLSKFIEAATLYIERNQIIKGNTLGLPAED